MKQSGYRTTFHIYSIFFLSLLGTLLVVCCLFAMLITAPNPNGKNVRSDWAKNFTLDFSDYIIFVDGSATVKQTGIERLQDNHIGLQILDTAGNEVYACQKPGNAQDTYSNADLLQLNQTGHLDTEDMTSFVGIVTECGKEYAYILHFPMNIQKVTMYLNCRTAGNSLLCRSVNRYEIHAGYEYLYLYDQTEAGGSDQEFSEA